MIPTLIVAGLIFGRWWRTTLIVAAVAWPIALLIDGIDLGFTGVLGAAVLGAANAAVGVLVHQALRQLVRTTTAARRTSS